MVAGLLPHDAMVGLLLMTVVYRLPPAVAPETVAAVAPCRVANAAAEVRKAFGRATGGRDGPRGAFAAVGDGG